MDDRDFIYWLYGVFEYGNISIISDELAETIIENVCEVYDHTRDSGVLNDFEALRLAAFLEGCLMYYPDLSDENKERVSRLIKNEILDIGSRYRDRDETFAPYPMINREALNNGQGNNALGKMIEIDLKPLFEKSPKKESTQKTIKQKETTKSLPFTSEMISNLAKILNFDDLTWEGSGGDIETKTFSGMGEMEDTIDELDPMQESELSKIVEKIRS